MKDIVKFDDQLIDVVTGWLIFRRMGYSVHACLFYAGSVLMPEPSASEWQRVDGELAELPPNGPHHLGIPLDSLLQRVPSENLKLLVEVFRQNREEGYGGTDLDERMRKLLGILWERHDPATKPPITNYAEIVETLKTFTFSAQESICAESRARLLPLGSHLLPYLICTLENSGVHYTIPIFSLLKALSDEGTVKNMRRYAETPKTHHWSRYGAIARTLLDELGIHYTTEQIPGTQCQECGRLLSEKAYGDGSNSMCAVCHKYVINGCAICNRPGTELTSEYCWVCQKYVCPEHQFHSNYHTRAVFCSAEHQQEGNRHLAFWN